METQTNNQPTPRTLSWFRLIRRLFVWSVITLVVLFGAALLLLKIYEDDVKNYAVGFLNENLASPVLIHPENIDVSLLSSFPFASVDFKDMRALDAGPAGIPSGENKKDTLFRARLISLQFNVMNLLNGNYSFQKLEIDGMDLNLKIDSKGKNNYSIFKASTDSAPKQFELKLEQILIHNSHLTYHDRKKNTFFDSQIGLTEMSGDFSAEKYELSVNSNLLVNDFRSDSTHYLTDKPLDLKMIFDANGDEFKIQEGKLKIADLNLSVEGAYKTGDEKDFIGLKVKGEEMSISSVLSLLPPSLTEKMNAFESEGEFFFQAEINGDPSDPEIASSFGIKGGTITETSTSVSLENVSLNGDYLNKPSASLSINDFEASIEGGQLSGKLKISDMHSKARLVMSLAGNIGLKELNGFMKIDTISSIEGQVKMNINYSGPLKSDISYSIEDLESISTSGEVEITGGAIELKNSTMKFSELKGNFSLQNADVKVNNFSGKALSSDIMLKGEFRDLVKYFLSDKHTMTIDAAFVSDLIDLNELLSNKNEETKSDTAYNLSFPERIDLKLETRVAKTVFRNFEATLIKGDLLMRDRKLIMDPVSFKTMDGMVSTMLMVDADRPDDILITMDASIKSINVNKLFTQMENFGQTYLVDRHLKGFLTSEIQLATVWGRDLSVDLDKIYARGNIMIERGELIGFEPFLEIADDMKKDVLMREMIDVDEFKKKMEIIKFTTLENEIEIRKQKISIPKMEVKSSAMDITFFGTHTFKNKIDYHFSFLLSQVLTKQQKKRVEKNKEFGVEEDDGTGKILYYTMIGTTDKYELKKDYKSKKEKRKEDVKKEKETLKDILRDEFGWFKKDTTGKKKEEPKKQDKFILKWDESEKKEKEPEEDDF